VFRRYDIIDEADLADAAARLDEKWENQIPDFGQTSDMVAPKPGNRHMMPLLAPLSNQ
jgi:hypothetical protein